MAKEPLYFHDDYEKLVDDIYIFGGNAVLRMNVILANKNENGDRYHYHQEFMYSSDKYVSKNKLITLRRSMKYYMTIENLKPVEGEKEFIMIGVQNILNVKNNLERASHWFTSEKFSNLFAYSKDDKLVLLGKVNPITISGLPQDKKIVLEPIVITYENISYEGIRMYLNRGENYLDITVDVFMGLLYLFSTINMYESAQLLMNYHGRPEMGTGLMVFNGNNNYIEEKTEVKNNRKIPGTIKKSYFDKIDDL